jgi:hypothetical protein
MLAVAALSSRPQQTGVLLRLVVHLLVEATSVSDELTIDVQPTPNVNALKFVTNRRVTEGRSQTFRSADDAAGSALAATLLSIPGVVQVFFLNDFITVTRDPAADWNTIAGEVERLIRGHLSTTR